MYDIFIYPYIPSPSATPSMPGFIIEYDPRAASTSTNNSSTSAAKLPPTPPLTSMLKRYILRSKVKVRDVSQEWRLFAAWPSTSESSSSDMVSKKPDEWRRGRSGAIEPIYNEESDRKEEDRALAEMGLEERGEVVWAVDRRAPGMGVRLLLRSGDCE